MEIDRIFLWYILDILIIIITIYHRNKSIRGPLGLKIERDVHFQPTRYEDVKELKC